MKKVLLISALMLTSSGAWAQSSQGQSGAQAGTNGNADTTMQSGAPPNGMREGTTSGMSPGSQTGSANGTPNARPITTTGPTGQASKTESPPK
jgi:hypothetical protein